MILYRAMCEEEFQNTILNGRPAFRGRFKFFSPDLDFIISRVRDGKFAKQDRQPDRSAPYRHIVQFVVQHGAEHLRRLNDREIMMDVRKSPLVAISVIG